MEYLKTSCNSCINDHKAFGCSIGKETILDGDKRFTDGFCEHKQVVYTEKDLSKTLPDTSGKISCVILVKTQDIDKFQKTVSSIGYFKRIITELFILSEEIDKEFTNKTVDILKRSYGGKWNIEFFDRSSGFDTTLSLDWCSKKIKNNWIMSLEEGDVLNVNCTFLEEFNTKWQNPVAFYLDNRILTPYTSYSMLQGNFDNPYLDKLKHFKNWEKVCHKMPRELLLSRQTSTTVNTSQSTGKE